MRGIDISEFQGYLTALDFERMKEDNVSFVIIRAGTTLRASKEIYIDQYSENNYREAKKAAMPVGAYWNSNATTIPEIIQETDTMLRLIQNKQFEYPIFIDTEGPVQALLDRQTLTNLIKYFLETIEDRGYYVGIYASSSWFRDHLNLSQLNMYDRWIASWSRKPTLSHGMWQYSSQGRVNGIIGNVDLDIAYYDYPQIMIENGLNGYQRSSDFRINDKVLLLEDATIYQGASLGVKIPESIKNKVYTIQQVGRNTLLLREIYSWVLKSQCRKIED